jgi:ribulose bisphosphate carboxylase small subunit
MGYYIAPQFLNKISVHITKNFLDLPNVKAPLILGIHGRKGEGKSFQCELAYKRMGIGVVYMSGGELESPDAGDPARLIRLRYREAGEWSRMHGRMAVLMINDLDAGAGRFDQFTQYTVNTQLVNATLMNIADNPTNVQLPGSYEEEPTQRIPIVVTGNDFSTLYAPLIRDGRMEKFYWEPSHGDRVTGMFEIDGVHPNDLEQLVNAFPQQAIDFFGALRSRLYDEQVLQFIQTVGIDQVSQQVMNSIDAPPKFRKPNFSLSHLLEMGNQIVQEQERIREMQLVQEYNVGQQALRRLEVHPSNSKRESGRTRRTEALEIAKNGDRPMPTPPQNQASPPPSTPSTNNHPVLNPDALNELKTLLNQGDRVGIEYVNPRRFRTNSWNNYATVQGETEAIAILKACLQEHAHDYIRLVAITPDRRRGVETIIQRP